MKTDIFKAIAQIIGIPFSDETIEVSEVCFANSTELRPDFKLQFTTNDVLNYSFAQIYERYWKENKKLKPTEIYNIPYPPNAAYFWQYATAGKKYCNENPTQKRELIPIEALNWYKT